MKVGMVLRCTVVAAVCCTMMVGCKKGCKKSGSTTGGTTDITGAGAVGGAGVGTGLEANKDQFGGPGDRTALAPQTVYFAYDSAAINPTEQPKLQAVADYVKAHAGAKILVEGHCDERGTEEYNRALGERRALAAREALIGLGVDAGSIQTISYGKDRAADPGHDEAAWSKNRRDEFVVVQ